MPQPTIYTDSLNNVDPANAAGRADVLRELQAAGGDAFVADSIAGSGTHIADSIAGSDMFAADSAAVTAAPDTLSRLAVSAGEMFGTGSSATGNTVEQLPDIMTTYAPGITYQLMVLCLALFYFFVIMTQRAEIAQSLGTLFGKRHEKMNAGNSYVYGRTMKILGVMAAFTLGIAVLRRLHAIGIIPTTYLSWHALIVVLVVAAAILVINQLQQLVLKLAGALTFENKFVASLLSMRRMFAAVIGLTITPVVFIFALTGASWAFAGFCIALTMLSLYALGYMCYSFKFFVDEKVSILVWFLYLCAVEVVPYGILILGILRTA